MRHHSVESVRIRERVAEAPHTHSIVALVLTLALAVLALTVLASRAPAQGIGYTLTPTASYVSWDDDLGLDDAYLYGGRFSFDFGRFIALRPFYLFRSNIDSRLNETGLVDTLGNPLVGQQADLRHYGADLLIAFGGGSAVQPFIKGGGSIFNVDPETGAATRQVGFNYGGGIRFGAPAGLQAELGAALWRFRLDRFVLAEPDAGLDPDATDPTDEVYRNLAVTLGVNLPFGGARDFGDAPPRLDWSRTGVPIELYAGRLNYADEVGLDDQDLVGARTGVLLGDVVGLQGFYWRGTESGFDATDPVQGWGGEARFNLNENWSGVSPFLVIGAGKIDYKNDFRDPAGNTRDDKTMIIGGAGLTFGLTENLRLHAAARDYIFSAGELDEVSRTEELRHNWVWSAGLHFFIGGSGREARRARAERLAAPDTIIVVLDADTLRAARLADSLRMLRLATQQRQAQVQPQRERADAGYVSGRTVNVPVPEQGELYVRYGPAADSIVAVSPDEPRSMMDRRPMAMRGPGLAELRETIRETVREELDRDAMYRALYGGQRMAPEAQAAGRVVVPEEGAAVAPAMTMAFEDRIVERLAERLELQRRADMDTLRTLVRAEVAEALPQAEEINTVVAEAVRQEIDRQFREGRLGGETRVVVETGDDTLRQVRVEREQPGPTFQPRQWSAYTGYGFEASQMLVGVRADLGNPWLRYTDVYLVPEVSLGLIGGDLSLMAAGNLQYRFPDFGLGGFGELRPFVDLGLGLLYFGEDVNGREGIEAVLNLGYGIGTPLSAFGDFGMNPARVFIMHQGVDAFSINRLLIGLQSAF